MRRPRPPTRLALALTLVLVSLAARGVRADDPPAPPEPGVPPTPRSPEAARPARPPGRIGFSSAPAATVTAEHRTELGIPAEATGIFVLSVAAGSPAATAGLRVGDRLVSMQGKPVPDLVGTKVAAWGDAFTALTSPIRAGDEVTIEVERAGEKQTLKTVAVDTPTLERLTEAATKARSLEGAGTPSAFAETFDAFPGTGAVPGSLLPASGRWTVVPAEEKERGQVLRQDVAIDPWAVALFTGPGRALADGTVTVKFRPVSGREDASGGIVFRARDAKNYYLVRANALEGNFRFYSVKDGNRWQIAGVDADPPPLGTWHELSVTFRGKDIRATLDGKAVLTGKDDLFLAPGWVGLWTKADSVTEFDDLKVTPEAPTAPPPEPKPTK